MGNEQTLEDTGLPPRMNLLWARSMLSIRKRLQLDVLCTARTVMAGENQIQIPISLKAKNSFASKGSVGKQTKKPAMWP